MSEFGSRKYAAVFLALGVLALLMAVGLRTQDLLLAGLTLGLYGLHLVSMRSIRDQQERQSDLLREVGAALDDLSAPSQEEGAGPTSGGTGGASPASAPGSVGGGGRGAPAGDTGPDERSERGAAEGTDGDDRTVPRNLRIGTVAVVEEALEPREVSRIMSIHERKPQKTFGDVAVEMGLLDRDQVEELLEIKETGLYSKRKLTSAKARLREFLGKKSD